MEEKEKDYSPRKELSRNSQLLLAASVAALILLGSVYATFNSLKVRNTEKRTVPDRLKQMLTPTVAREAITREEAESLVRNVPEVENYLKENSGALVEADRENVVNNTWIVHVYSVENLSRVTFNWYEVDKGTKEVEKLLDTDFSPNPITNDGCVVSGCNNEICADEERISTCEYHPRYECYNTAACESQVGGECGWTMDKELTSCLDQFVSEPSI